MLPFRLISALTILSMLIGGCHSTTPPIGTIEIDSDKPSIHNGKLPIGLTIGSNSQHGKDLLNHNILANGGFELAQKPENCTYNPTTKILTTPNGYSIKYPGIEAHWGWEKVRGLIEVRTHTSEGYKGHYLSLHPSGDSIPEAAVLHTGNPFAVTQGSEYSFSIDVYSSVDMLSLSIVLVDTSMVEVSSVHTLSLSSSWEKHNIPLKVKSDTKAARLLLRTTGSGGGSVHIDNCVLTQTGHSVRHGLDSKLYALIKGFGADFLRFPEGRVANGYFLGTYPDWQSLTLPQKEREPIWTIKGEEYSGAFGIEEFLDLSDDLRVPPIYITNVGITDITANPRSENIKDLEERSHKIVALGKYIRTKYNFTPDSMRLTPAIQLGYDMTMQDYARRFNTISEQFKAEDLQIDLISSADMTRHQRFSNYVFDASGSAISSPHISDLIPDIEDEVIMLRQPVMLGECHFIPSKGASFIPSLVLRAAFMLNAERKTTHLHGITMTPFLSDTRSSEYYPLILVNGNTYTPTELYHLLHAFVRMRGERLRELNEVESTDAKPIRSLYTSLTSSPDNSIFYLKAVNTTRHPLPYRIVFKGKAFSPKRVNSIHFRPKAKTTTQDLSEFNDYTIEKRQGEIRTSQVMSYTFAPYEIVFFEYHNK